MCYDVDKIVPEPSKTDGKIQMTIPFPRASDSGLPSDPNDALMDFVNSGPYPFATKRARRREGTVPVSDIISKVELYTRSLNKNLIIGIFDAP
jgi:hypothetical protein